MTNMALFAEQQVRADLARLLLAAVEASGRARCDIARDAQIHKDALRRVLAGERSATRLIRLPEVQHRVGLGRSTIYRWMSEGKFPKPVQLGGYAVAWGEEDIIAWVESQLKR